MTEPRTKDRWDEKTTERSGEQTMKTPWAGSSAEGDLIWLHCGRCWWLSHGRPLPHERGRVTLRHRLLLSKGSHTESVFSWSINTRNGTSTSWILPDDICISENIICLHKQIASVCFHSSAALLSGLYIYMTWVLYTCRNTPIHPAEANVSSYSFSDNKAVNPLILTSFQPPPSSSIRWPTCRLGNNLFFPKQYSDCLAALCVCTCLHEREKRPRQSIMTVTAALHQLQEETSPVSSDSSISARHSGTILVIRQGVKIKHMKVSPNDERVFWGKDISKLKFNMAQLVQPFHFDLQLQILQLHLKHLGLFHVVVTNVKKYLQNICCISWVRQVT